MAHRTMKARYPGTCARCDEPIVPGQRIVETSAGRTIHVTCLEED